MTVMSVNERTERLKVCRCQAAENTKRGARLGVFHIKTEAPPDHERIQTHNSILGNTLMDTLRLIQPHVWVRLWGVVMCWLV